MDWRTGVEIGVLIALWAAVAVLSRVAMAGPRNDPLGGLAWLVLCAYARLIHRVQVEGAEHIPAWRQGDPPAGPLIVVSNHTAGIDPLLIQYAIPFEVRWMMMRGMMPAGTGWLWEWLGVIPVAGSGRDSAPVRLAMRHLIDRGVLGLFPEGKIERPHGVVMPFHAGVGLLALKTQAPVLPVVIRGTPRANSAYESFLIPSRTRVRFLPLRRYGPDSGGSARIAEDLEAEVARELNWPRTRDLEIPDGEGEEPTPG